MKLEKKNKITELFALELAKHNKLLKDINNNNYFLKNKNTENKVIEINAFNDIY